MSAPTTESLVAFFQTRAGPTHDFLVALDRSLHVIARSRGVAALEADLPAQLEQAGDRLAELAVAVGDIHLTGPKEVRVARAQQPLYVSAYPAVDVSDPPMPTFATRRVVVAAYMVYTEALLLHVQSLYAGWRGLVHVLVLHDNAAVGLSSVPPVTQAALSRWVGDAKRVAAKIRGLDTTAHAASFDADVALRQTFLGLSASVCGLAESMCSACACLLAARTVSDLRIIGTKKGPRLEASSQRTVDAVLACALGLHRAALTASLTPCAYVGLNARMLRWRLDVGEMARLYTVFFWALACDGKRLREAVQDWRSHEPTETSAYGRALDEFVRACPTDMTSMQANPFRLLLSSPCDRTPDAQAPRVNPHLDFSRR